MNLACAQLFFAFWTLPSMMVMMMMIGETEMLHLNEVSVVDAPRNSSNTSTPGAQRKHAISKDMMAILDFHNNVRSRVTPRAANMEYMLWDEALAASAQFWASQCTWAHGPPEVLVSNGQNLSLFPGRNTSITDILKSWYNERLAFFFPDTCNNLMCGHYIQMVWAASNKIGCAVRRCSNMDVSGRTWKRATLLVCNYNAGSRVGKGPYLTGKPCSACPSSYKGSCKDNMCFSKPKPRRSDDGVQVISL